MRKTILLICLLATAGANVTNAQTPLSRQIEQARIQMLKHTVEFLASDTTTFKVVNTTECDCKTLDDINNFIKENKLTNVDVAINTINTKADTTDKQWRNSLQLFKNNIIAAFITGQRGHRRNMAGYKAFEQNLQQSINNIKPPVKIVTDTAKKTVNTTTTGVIQAGPAFPVTNIILLVAVAGLLALSYLLLSRNKKTLRQFDLEKRNNQLLRDQLNDCRIDIENYRTQLFDCEEELRSVKEEKQNLEKLLDKQKQEQPATDGVENITTFVPQEKAPQPVKKYAKYADAGDGFSDLYLLDQPNNETIFEITVTAPGLATYTVSNDPTVQKYALSNTDYFLRKTCQYDSFPASNSTIYTQEPGKLRKEGGKWSIQTAAKISFN